MEADREAESRQKLDQRTREIAQQLRELEEFKKEEQEEFGTRSRGNQRAVNLDRQCQGVAMKVPVWFCF